MRFWIQFESVMADCVAVTLHSKCQPRLCRFRDKLFLSGNLSPKLSLSLCRSNFSKSQNFRSPSFILSTGIKQNQSIIKLNPKKCFCIRSLINSESYPPNWIVSTDQALLTISIVFAYLAGIIPNLRSYNNVKHYGVSNQSSDSTGETVYGRQNRLDLWDEIRVKLSQSLEGNTSKDGVNNGEIKYEKFSKNQPLSLLAIDAGPRFRLLGITLEQLQKEVNDVSQKCESLDWNKWILVSTELIKGLVEPSFIRWIQEEQALANRGSDTLADKMIRKLKEDERILKKLDLSGRAGIYADLLFFLRFSSLRCSGYYDAKLMIDHGIKILEDLVIFLSDGIASIYLEFISIDGDLYGEIDGGPGLVLCSLSTRSLQRIRNEVALNWWLYQYFESVVSMYEDRFELYILRRKERESETKHLTENINWWRVVFGKSTKNYVANYIQISPFLLSVKRTKELRALTGWRYYFSLFLELSDISMPFIRGAFTKISGALSYFLTYIIGRSLGLIFSGIRKALGWR